MGRAAPGEMPGVDPGLQVVADGQQPAVLRRKPVEDGGDPGPEGSGLEPGPRQGLGLDEGGQFPGDLKTGTRRHGHGALLGGEAETFRDDLGEVERFSHCTHGWRLTSPP